MKRYIREVFIPEYAKNFNKDLTAYDIKFYAKIHLDRKSTRANKDTDNQKINNMHCHIIVNRKYYKFNFKWIMSYYPLITDDTQMKYLEYKVLLEFSILVAPLEKAKYL